MRPRIAATYVVCVLAGPLAGCVAAIIAAVPIDVVATEVIPRAVNGKGLVEDGADLVTGKDCRVIEGIVRDERKICETRGSPATKKDFKGISGLSDRDNEEGAQ
jgi:hypothetical protein